MDTRIFGMVTGGKLALGLGKVKRAAVGLGSTSDHVDDKGDQRGHMAFEYKPQIRLFLYYTTDRHCAGEAYHGQYTEPDRELVADHLRARAESSDEGKLVVTRPAGKKDTEHTDRRHGDKKEDADIEIYDL